MQARIKSPLTAITVFCPKGKAVRVKNALFTVLVLTFDHSLPRESTEVGLRVNTA